MKDLNLKQKPKQYQPDFVDIAWLIIVVVVWVYMIIGSMM